MELKPDKSVRPTRVRANTRDAILDAATGVVNEIGAKHMTLDAVAAKAGISKGGLLYHFPSKEDLLTAMVGRLIDEMKAESHLMEHLDSDKPGLGLRAIVECRMASESDVGKREIASCIIAAAAERPGLLEPVLEFNRDVWSRVAANAGDTKVLSALMLGWFALEGVFLLDLLNIPPVGAALKRQLTDDALALLEGRLTITPTS